MTSARTVRFAAREWLVKVADQPVGPGPNRFSAANVHVDHAGRLHLRIAPGQTGWTCAEVIALPSTGRPFGYGRYRWRVATDVRALDPATVLGLFTWSDDPAQSHRELDIEFWGDLTAGRPGGTFTVQHPTPATHGFEPGTPPSEHLFTWSAGRVDFTGRFADRTHAWTHRSNHVPTPGGAVAPRMNLWLRAGRAPARPQHVVLDGFDYAPTP